MPLFLPISAQHLLFQFWHSEGQHSWPGGVSPSQLWWTLVYHHLLFVGFDFFFSFHWMAHCSKSPGIDFLLKWFYMFYKILLVCTESERTVISLTPQSGSKLVLEKAPGRFPRPLAHPGLHRVQSGLTSWIRFSSVCQQMLINVLLNFIAWVEDCPSFEYSRMCSTCTQ